MLQADQLRLVRAPDIFFDNQMDGLVNSDPTPARGMHRPRPATASMAMMNQDRQPATAAAAAAAQQALKCPRCDSTNTKFCYYNNYSQTQPRHFCKSCRRYWTQGGSLRNVPVGGGCRKNKRVKPRSLMNLSSHGHGSGLFDPNSHLLFDDDSTSQMLARLSNISSGFTANGGSPNFGEEQLLNIAFSRFQESINHRQLRTDSSDTSPEGSAAVPFFDMGFPSLVQQKPCPSSLSNAGTFENHLGFSSTLERRDTSCCNPSTFHLNPNFHNVEMATSATATLASIEDQLSNFSNLLQPHHAAAHDQPFHGEASNYIPLAQGEKRSMLGKVSTESSPLQLLQLRHDPSHHSASINTEHSITTELSHDPTNWQQPTFMMSESMLLNAHNNHHSHFTSSSRWQDMMYSLSTTAAAATAGGIL